MKINKNIVIIGGGASSIAFIDSFVSEYTNGKVESLTLTVFEKMSVLGPGSAYQSDQKSNILNTKAGYITAF